MNDFWYMMGIVAVGFAVNFGLRALPFVIFGTRHGELPRWVATFGNLIAPVIIAALIVYSYSGLAWKTVYPYLAGILTIGLQVWKRNALYSILAGTVLYMLLLNCCGCMTRRSIELDAQHPAVRVTSTGIFFGEEAVRIDEVAEILEDYDVPHDRAIHIQLGEDVKDLRPARVLMGYLGRAGYTRSVLVTKRHSEAINLGKRKRPTSQSLTTNHQPLTTKKTIRYKKASE